MAIYAVNYDGLRKRDTYNELIDYLQFKQEKSYILIGLQKG